jgi:hypothetical protein
MRRERLVLPECLERIGGSFHVKSLVAKKLGERGARIHLIINYQDSPVPSHLRRVPREVTYGER